MCIHGAFFNDGGVADLSTLHCFESSVMKSGFINEMEKP